MNRLPAVRLRIPASQSIFCETDPPRGLLLYLETAAKLLELLEGVLTIFSKCVLKSLNNQADFDSAILRFDPSAPAATKALSSLFEAHCVESNSRTFGKRISSRLATRCLSVLQPHEGLLKSSRRQRQRLASSKGIIFSTTSLQTSRRPEMSEQRRRLLNCYALLLERASTRSIVRPRKRWLYSEVGLCNDG